MTSDSQTPLSTSDLRRPRSAVRAVRIGAAIIADGRNDWPAGWPTLWIVTWEPPGPR